MKCNSLCLAWCDPKYAPRCANDCTEFMCRCCEPSCGGSGGPGVPGDPGPPGQCGAPGPEYGLIAASPFAVMDGAWLRAPGASAQPTAVGAPICAPRDGSPIVRGVVLLPRPPTSTSPPPGGA